MVRQVVIAAAGYGTRIPSELNPKSSKPLMEYAGQSMLGYVIDGLKEGGIEEFIVASGEHSHNDIEAIVSRKEVKARVISTPADGAQRIVYHLFDLLDDQFMFAFGHQPLPAEFVSRMLQTSQNGDCIATIYDNNKFPTNKKERTLFEVASVEPLLKRVNQDTEPVSQQHFYVMGPYVFPRYIIKTFAKNNFKSAPNYYIYQYWLTGRDVLAVEASMPSEFDYAHEFEDLKRFLDGLRKPVPAEVTK